MEEAGEIAAKRAGLVKQITEDEYGRKSCTWVKDGKRRSVHILHDPQA